MQIPKRLVPALVTAALALAGCGGGGSGAGLPSAATEQAHTRAVQSVAGVTLTVQTNTSAMAGNPNPGASAFFPCAVQITTSDPARYMLVAFADATGAYPVMRSPAPSYLALSVPDLSTPPTAVGNAGFPGHVLWRGEPGQTQTHCVDYTLSTPDPAPAMGSYGVTMRFVLLFNTSTSMYAARALDTEAQRVNLTSIGR